MYIHRFLLAYGGGASTGLVGATCFVVPVVCGYVFDVVVVVVGTKVVLVVLVLLLVVVVVITTPVVLVVVVVVVLVVVVVVVGIDDKHSKQLT